MRKAIPADLRTSEQVQDQGRSLNDSQSENTPQIEVDDLRCPADMTPGAKKEWKRIVKLYRACNIQVLNNLDKATLKSYCVAVDVRDRLYREWIEVHNCQILVDNRTSKKTTTSSGASTDTVTLEHLAVSKIIRELDRLANTIRVLAEQLALTPIGRAAYAVRTVRNNKSVAEEFMEDE